MDVTPQLGEDKQVITRYGIGHFHISGQRYETAVFIDETTGVQPLEITSAEQLNEAFFSPLLKDKNIEILIIGTGSKQYFLSPALRRALKTNYGCGVEVMDSGAACRTFNVLTSEDRRTAALLLPVTGE